MYKCSECNHIFTNPMPGEEALQYFYNSSFKDFENEFFLDSFENRIPIFRQRLELLKNIACWREELAIKYDIPKRWIFSDASATKLMLKHDKKMMEVINNIKQELTDSEMSKLMKILSLKKIIKNKNLTPKKDIEKNIKVSIIDPKKDDVIGAINQILFLSF